MYSCRRQWQQLQLARPHPRLPRASHLWCESLAANSLASKVPWDGWRVPALGFPERIIFDPLREPVGPRPRWFLNPLHRISCRAPCRPQPIAKNTDTMRNPEALTNITHSFYIIISFIQDYRKTRITLENKPHTWYKQSLLHIFDSEIRRIRWRNSPHTRLFLLLKSV